MATHSQQMKLVKVEDAGKPGGGSSSSYSSSSSPARAGAAWLSLLAGAEVVPLLVASVVVPAVASFVMPLMTEPSSVKVSCFASSMGLSTFTSTSEGPGAPFSIFTGSSSISSGYFSPTMHTSWNQSSLQASPRRHWYIVPVSLATS